MALTLRVVASAFTRPDTHSFGEDSSQVAELHVPRGKGPFPVVVVVHGGYWQPQWGKIIMRPLARDLVSRGFAAWNVEYRRLGDGRGGGGGWPNTFEDVERGIAALAELDDPRLDLGDVSIVGHSAGGQLALFAAGRSLDGALGGVEIRRAVGLAPVVNLAAVGRTAHALVGGTPQQVPDRYAVADPLRRAPLDMPVLIVHATDDATVPVRRSQEYAAAAGDSVELITPPEGGHRAPIDPDSSVWHAAAEWLERSRLESEQKLVAGA